MLEYEITLNYYGGAVMYFLLTISCLMFILVFMAC